MLTLLPAHCKTAFHTKFIANQVKVCLLNFVFFLIGRFSISPANSSLFQWRALCIHYMGQMRQNGKNLFLSANGQH